MSIYKVTDKSTIAPLFEGWEETFIWSCLQDIMGEAFADCHDGCCKEPSSAKIQVGDFIIFGGKAGRELAAHKPEGCRSEFAIMVPSDGAWEEAIEAAWQEKAKKITRYATVKDKNHFDREHLEKLAAALAGPYEMKQIDRVLYQQIWESDWAKDLCYQFPSYEEYERLGLGMAIVKDGQIVSGASSYIVYEGGIEIEVDTRADERQKGLAAACSAGLILECLKRGLYPSWDAHNQESLALAKKLGYRLKNEYPAYEIAGYCT